MDEHELTPIDELPPDIGDVLPTEDEDEDTPVDDEPYDPDMPDDSAGPDAVQDAPDMVPDFVEEPDDIDVLPTEDEEEETPVDDEPDGGEQPEEEDVLVNTVQVPVIGAVQEGELVPVIRMGDTPIAIGAAGWGDRMQSEVDLASQAAEEAKEVAEATGQHFWEDENGAHVTEITKEDWQTEEAKPNPFADVSDQKPYHNLLMNSLGILLRTALKNLVSITRSAIAFFDGQGNAAANVTASFGKDGFQVGVTGESHMVGDYHSLELVDKEGVGYFHVSDLRDRTGSVEVTETFVGDGTTTQFTISLSPDPSLTTLDVKVDGTSVANSVIRQKVFLTSAPAYGASVAITYTTEDNLAKAYTFGIRSDNHPVAPMSYAFGDDVAATMPFAYVEGDGTRAYGYASHAEGSSTVARGGFSHAEGYHTEAGPYAHAEGMACVASGPCSHANGRETVAASNHQTAIGHYNVEDANGDYALIIGNGTDDSNRSNALTVGWDGSVDAAGGATLGGTLESGDAITSHGSVFTKTDAIDVDGSNPSAVQYTRWFQCSDKDDDRVAVFGGARETDGRTRGFFYAYNKTSGGTLVNNHMNFYVDKNGNCTYGLSDPAAFREALRMRRGVVATRSVAAGSVATVDVTFSPALSSAPNVVCGLQSTQTQLMGNCSCVVTATSATGFTVALVNNSSSARNLGCYWIAM